MTQVKNFQAISYDELMDIDGGFVFTTAGVITGLKWAAAAFGAGFLATGGARACELAEDLVVDAFSSN